MVQVRFSADEAVRSMDDDVTTVLRTATDPDLAATGAEQLRERLARAGLLVADLEAERHGSVDEPRRFQVITAAAPMLEDAALLCARHGLRAHGGVQLATALTVVVEGGRRWAWQPSIGSCAAQPSEKVWWSSLPDPACSGRHPAMPATRPRGSGGRIDQHAVPAWSGAP